MPVLHARRLGYRGDRRVPYPAQGALDEAARPAGVATKGILAVPKRPGVAADGSDEEGVDDRAHLIGLVEDLTEVGERQYV